MAGIIGAGITWFFLGGGPRSATSTPPPAPPSSGMVSDAPPNVAHLPPADAAVLLGNWHYDRARWLQAIEQYEGALRLGKDNADVRTDLGNCFRFIKQPQKALEQYEISQRMQPQHENSLFNQAALYGQELNQVPRAKELLNEYLRRFPASPGIPRAQQLLAEFTAKEQADAAQLKQTLQPLLEK
ncbi:MAG: hypothetical protein ACO1QR_01080 [Chthoniobacteraceae bacterium]